MRLMIVEDDRQLGDALAHGLRQLGNAVDWFQDGIAANAAISSAPFDAVVLDLGLPGEDGLLWLRRWRQSSIKVPILVLTARDAVEQRVAGLDAGADDYLIKPIALEELTARLRALTRRTAGHAQSLWEHGSLVYDPAAKVAQWRGAPVQLTGREMALLEAFLSQPQRVLSRDHLLEKLYDWSGSEPEGNSLEVHIHHLRRKIDPNVVRTVRGVGYALGPCELSP